MTIIASVAKFILLVTLQFIIKLYIETDLRSRAFDDVSRTKSAVDEHAAAPTTGVGENRKLLRAEFDLSMTD